MRYRHDVRRLWLAMFVSVTLGACSNDSEPNMDEVESFIEQAEARLLSLWIESGRAAWVQNNFITEDTNKMASAASAELMAATTELATAAARIAGGRQLERSGHGVGDGCRSIPERYAKCSGHEENRAGYISGAQGRGRGHSRCLPQRAPGEPAGTAQCRVLGDPERQFEGDPREPRPGLVMESALVQERHIL